MVAGQSERMQAARRRARDNIRTSVNSRTKARGPDYNHQSPHINIIKEFMASYKHYLTFSDLDQVPAELNVKTWLSDSDRQYVHSDKRVL